MRKKGIKQFNKMNLILLVLWFVLVFSISILVEKWWLGLLIFGVTYFIYAKINAKLRFKYVESILYQDLDAKRYYDELLFNSKSAPNLIQSVVANWFVGNHKQMENILEENIKNYEGNDKNILLSYLKFVYFETRNKEKLKEVMNRTEEFPKGVSGEFFSHYLNGEYESCFVECDKIEEWLKNLKNKNKNLPFEMLRVEFMRAVAYHDLGELEKSHAIFDAIIKEAPNIHYAEIASEYFKAMETGDEQYISTEELFIDRYKVENTKPKKKRSPWVVALIWVLIVALVIGIVWGFYMKTDENTEPRDEAQILYDQRIHYYLYDHFGDYEILYGYRLDGEDIYVIKSNGKYSIIGYVFYLIEDNKPITTFKIYASNIDFDNRYESDLLSTRYKVSFMITEDYFHVSPEAFFVEVIELDGKDYFFVIWKEDNASDYSDTSSYDKDWSRFWDFVADNPYDIWLEAELNEGIEMPWYIYSDYIKFWIAEYEFTLEYARDFFDDEQNYLSWKADNEAWLKLTRELYRIEVSNFDAQMERLEITIPYSKVIRQKVIDTKYFLYRLEINEKMISSDLGDEYVSLQWKGMESDN